jgi:hypothetical protein
MHEQENLVECVELLMIAIFKRILQWDDNEVQVSMAKLRNEFREGRIESSPVFISPARNPFED